VTSFAIKPFARSLSVRTTRRRLLTSLATVDAPDVDAYRAAAEHERGLASAIAGSWPLVSGPYRV
jgi:hypothetical protein